MTKDEFREFCHKTLIDRGFHKKGNSRYYLNGEKRMLCCIDLQKSMADGYYLNFCYYEGEFNKIKDYPPPYIRYFVFSNRIIVPQQNPGKVKTDPTTALIEYEFYSEEDLLPILNKEINKIILPVQYGKEYLRDHFDEYDEVKSFNHELFLEKCFAEEESK